MEKYGANAEHNYTVKEEIWQQLAQLPPRQESFRALTNLQMARYKKISEEGVAMTLSLQSGILAKEDVETWAASGKFVFL